MHLFIYIYKWIYHGFLLNYESPFFPKKSPSHPVKKSPMEAVFEDEKELSVDLSQAGALTLTLRISSQNETHASPTVLLHVTLVANYPADSAPSVTISNASPLSLSEEDIMCLSASTESLAMSLEGSESVYLLAEHVRDELSELASSAATRSSSQTQVLSDSCNTLQSDEMGIFQGAASISELDDDFDRLSCIQREHLSTGAEQTIVLMRTVMT